ncbi:ATP synthase F1, epsilon subunit [Nitrospirillum viridazoti Y2]|uniref:ATP synthase epsilon chain n=1 Tax=Nitrospirillum amazonense TaxID=28077 RepID=A0A560J0M3_9PROT|nr:F0F1 ATP synthase subunit epsilon [Nitrospirillum amazonense]EGY02599.1 ATP synthase F1, epsilon subunit [Nitrospirillum amazonense Y2]TWB62180.1 ATP synthase F1 subcomplex epsilon subunit [Nitrospirillum amazonense]
MADKVEFELVSPEKLLVSQPVDMVVVPGTEGYLGALPGHAPLITTLKPGVIDIYLDGITTISNRIFVAGGFAEVTETRCTVLAEEAVEVAALDRAAVEQQVKDLAEDVADAANDVDKRAAEAKLLVAQAKLEALGTGPAAH